MGKFKDRLDTLVDKVKDFFTPDVKRCLGFLAFAAFGFYINLVVGNYSVYRHNRSKTIRPPLPDVIFDLYFLDGYDTVAVDMPYYFLLFFLMIWFLVDSRRFKIISHVGLAFGTVYCMRALSIVVTLMPPAKKIKRLNMQVKDLFWIGGNISEWYGDYMFSGHISSTTVLVSAYYTFLGKRKSLIVPSIIIGALYLYLCVIIILTRFHYTSDILIAIFVAVPTWISTYHWLRNLRKREKSDGMFMYSADYSLNTEE